MVAGKIKEWNNDNGHSDGSDILLISKLRSSGLESESIEAVLDAIESTCTQCWDSEVGCQCWNDE